MPRFVILSHTTSNEVHFDAMFEAGDALRTWALLEPPRVGTAIACRQLSDHRAAYLDYEGPISGDRGEVARWDAGVYQLEEASADCWRVILDGAKLVGRAVFRRTSTEAGFWVFEMAADES